ncbi:hypothetical protein PVAG01_06299 [Phlyctema vagabunda]|uniref:Bromo domain-containing protein n=1 Tax=Phlyctema vagabunda TaxID=108571 RepID=A0ABR4PFM7_9HELO
MDSKRKVNGGRVGATEELDDRATKRRKGPTEPDLSKGETRETVKEHGLAFLAEVKKLEERRRAIATAFLELPDKNEIPDYYDVIKLPIALSTIERKLRNNEFQTLTSLESYVLRMVQNAKDYNERGSQIYADAERIKKALVNYMTKHNPAHKKPNFVCQPTPIPGGASSLPSEADSDEDSKSDIRAPQTKKRGRPPKKAGTIVRVQSRRSSATPATGEGKFSSINSANLNFQQAQEKLVTDLIRYKEDPEDEFRYYEIFVNLPDRGLKDYYQKIPNPMSLNVMQNRVKGNHGKNTVAGVSDYKSWATFEEDMSLIWKNAKHYNEDGSEIFNLATEFEIFFRKAVREAKQAVPDPIVPKIKLKLPQAAEPAPKITLKLGGKSSPVPSPAPQVNGSNGATLAARRNPFGNSAVTATPLPSLDQLERARSKSGSAASPTPSNPTKVKNEEGARNSPAILPSASQTLSGTRTPSQSVSTPPVTGMPPPTAASNLQNSYTASGYAQSFNHSQYAAPVPPFESKFRPVGKGAADAMITNLSVATHPGLNISQHFRITLPPSETMAQQSVTINLPSTHYYLQIKPTIAPSLLERQYKLFVTSGTQRLLAMPTIPGHSVDQRHPLFETRILPGVNRIEIELIAALPRGTVKPVNGSDIELEKITIFANLLT